MRYLITRHDGVQDEITAQGFANYDDAYEILEKIYADICCSDADYEERPYYEIIEVKDWTKLRRVYKTININKFSIKVLEKSKLSTYIKCLI